MCTGLNQTECKTTLGCVYCINSSCHERKIFSNCDTENEKNNIPLFGLLILSGLCFVPIVVSFLMKMYELYSRYGLTKKQIKKGIITIYLIESTIIYVFLVSQSYIANLILILSLIVINCFIFIFASCILDRQVRN